MSKSVFAKATRCPQSLCMAGSRGRLLIRSPVDWWRNLASPLSRPKITTYSMQEVAREKRETFWIVSRDIQVCFKEDYENKIFPLLLFKTQIFWGTRPVVDFVSLGAFYAPLIRDFDHGDYAISRRFQSWREYFHCEDLQSMEPT